MRFRQHFPEIFPLARPTSSKGIDILRRFQLFEIHDSPWCPQFLRDSLTDFLEASIDAFHSYEPIQKRLLNFLDSSGTRRVVDLCSGAGGPWLHWVRAGQVKADVTLTDWFPNASAQEQVIALHSPALRYLPMPINAMSVPRELQGLRTMFSAFHHFDYAAAAKIVEDAVVNRQPIAICEVTNRSVRSLLLMLLTPLGVWLLTPRMKNRSWSKLIFTYLLPIIPLVITFDSLVSCLRTYSVAELALFASAPNYVWMIGSEQSEGMPITYLMGYPR